MDVIRVRPLENLRELETCFDLWAAVFPDGRTFFQERLAWDTTYRLDTTWVATVNDTIASAIQIFPYTSWIDGVPVKVGGIGNVATLPEYRGRGLSQAILRQQSKWMRAENYDLSLLFTGIYSFYAQVGWDQVPERRWTLNADRVRERIRQMGDTYVLSPFAPEDLAGVRTIYDAANVGKTCAWQRTVDYWTGQLRWRHEDDKRFVVAKQREQVVGYIRCRLQKDGELQIGELSHHPSQSDVVSVLVAEALRLHPTAKSVSVQVPADHELARLAVLWDGQSVEFPHSMWKIIDLPALMHKLEPLFTRRIASSPGPDHDAARTLLLRCGGEEVMLSIEARSVRVAPVGSTLRYHLLVECSVAELATLLTQGADAVNRVDLRYHPLLRVLFPAQSAILWAIDFF